MAENRTEYFFWLRSAHFCHEKTTIRTLYAVHESLECISIGKQRTLFSFVVSNYDRYTSHKKFHQRIGSANGRVVHREYPMNIVNTVNLTHTIHYCNVFIDGMEQLAIFL